MQIEIRRKDGQTVNLTVTDDRPVSSTWLGALMDRCTRPWNSDVVVSRIADTTIQAPSC